MSWFGHRLGVGGSTFQEQLQRELKDGQEYVRRLEAALQASGIDVEPLREAFEEEVLEGRKTGAPSGAGKDSFSSPFFRAKLDSDDVEGDLGADATHSCEVRFEGLSYTVEKAATTAATLTVGAQCLRLWSLPLRCVLGKRQARPVKLQVLKDLHGILRPGRLTLLLGPPGSGKSTFLKALSGRLRKSRSCHLRGRITYNGDAADSKRFSLPKVVALVPQEDCHAATLTVQETVQFAFDCMSEGSQDPGAATLEASTTPMSLDTSVTSPLLTPHKQAADRVDKTLQTLGLKRCGNTIVGNALLRGISGGEKKRLTTAEMTGGHINVLLMDSISTGLDSAATFDICKTLASCTRVLHANIVVCLLQPPPEVFCLFDDVLLMDKGRLVYQGPRQGVLTHFESLGFRCPARKDVADFLVEVTTPAGKEYEIPEDERTALGLAPPPRTTEEFVQRFQRTPTWAKLMEHMAEEPRAVGWLSRQKREFSNTWLRSTLLCLGRQVKITARDRVFLRSRVMQVLLMGVMCGTLFYQLPSGDWSDKICLLFFSLMFTALGNLATIPTVYEQRNVFYKHRDSGFFPTSSAVIAQMLVQIPIQAVEALIFSSLAYFLSGLSAASHGYYYSVFALVTFSTALAVGQYFRLIVHIVPGLPQAQPLSALTVLLFVVFSGLTIKGADIPTYWLWLYWLNPLAWGLRALAINEFTSPNQDYQKLVPYPPPVPHGPKPGKLPLGDVYLLQLGFETSRDWIWFGVAYLLGMWLVLVLLTTAAMHWIRWTGADSLPVKKAKEDPSAMGEAEALSASGHLESIHGTPSRARARPEEDDDEEAAANVRVVARGRGVREGNSMKRSEDQQQGVLSFTPVTLVFRDLTYAVDLRHHGLKDSERVELLQGVSGYARPGTLTALMGSSGAGKTTLMDCLSGRKTTGHMTGDILVNGYPKKQRTFCRIAGYVEQMDVHSPHSTVREALEFSAVLRLPYHKVSEAQRQAFVEDLLGMLELDGIADRVIGEDSSNGLLMGERKRVTIGVELVANPSVLFLDEPTTGLDAHSALVVMRTVRNIARHGRSVIATIHQPSAAIFEMFDMLLLLRHGGRTVYFGPAGSSLIDYLESVPGVRPIKPGVNPANWMLECIGAGINPASESVDFADWYAHSDLCLRNRQDLDRLLESPSGLPCDRMLRGRFAAPMLVQLRACCRKAALNYWRSPNYNFSRMLISVLVAVVFGSVFHHKPYDTEQTVLGRVGLIYLSTSFVGIVNMMSVMPVMAKERAAFYREQASSSYHVIAYAISYGIVELPYILITTGLFVNTFYWFVGLAAEPLSKFVFYWVFFALYITCTVFIGQFLICLLPNQQTAQVAGAALGAIMNLFGGYLCTPKNIKPFWKFVFYLVPTHYLLEGLVMTQFKDDDTPVKLVYGAKPVPAWTYIYDHFGGEFSYGHVWMDVSVLLGYIVALRVGTFLALSFVRHINR